MVSRVVKPSLVLVGVVAAGMALGGCSYSHSLTAPSEPPRVAAGSGPGRGRVLYLGDCAWCHAADGSGTVRAPDIISGENGPAFTDFMVATGRMPLDSPDQPMTRRPPEYSAGEIKDIVDFVSTLGAPGPAIPTPDPASGHLGSGAELYLENCAACHSTTAIGGALTSGSSVQASDPVAPGLRSATPREVAEAMLVGPGTMPVFGADTFTSKEVDSIVRYVVYLQKPNDRGGTPLEHVGPVTEGAVGWILGLGVLLVVVRWIGTRTGDQ